MSSGGFQIALKTRARKPACAARAAWQSGLYYVDGTPKTSLAPVQQAVQETHGGVVATCPDLQLKPKVKLVPHAPKKGMHKPSVTVTANLDSKVTIRVQPAAGGRPTRRGLARTVDAGMPQTFVFPVALAKGRYRFTAVAAAAANAGAPVTVVSRPFVVR